MVFWPQSDLKLKKREPLERAPQEEQNGTKFSFPVRCYEHRKKFDQNHGRAWFLFRN